MNSLASLFLSFTPSGAGAAIAQAGRARWQRRLRLLASMLLPLGFVTPAQANCGQVAERACTIIERIPSCDLNLVESGGRCVRPACGRQGERMCGPSERVMFDFILKLPVPQPCDANLKADIGRGVCFHPPCGTEGQRACSVFERLPSCDVNLVEAAGLCIRPPCGRLNERICGVSVRNTSGIWLGMCDANLMPGPGEVCIRPGLALAGAQPPAAQPQQTHGATAVTAPPPPAAGSAPPAPPRGGVPPPPGRFAMPPPPAQVGAVPPPPPRAGVVAAPPPLPAVAHGAPPPPVAAGGSAGNLSATWRINGNGYPGDVIVRQAPDGSLSGSIYGDALSGYYAPGERVAVLLRGPVSKPIQAFIGQVSPDGASISGRLYALNATSAGGAPARNVFAFAALRHAPNHPGHPGVPNSAAGLASIAGTHNFNGNGFVGQFTVNQGPDGSLSGSVYGNQAEGHYAAGTGSLAFIRYSGPGQPFQLFVGTVTPGGMRGEFYALNGSAGASPQRMRYDWSAANASPARNLR